MQAGAMRSRVSGVRQVPAMATSICGVRRIGTFSAPCRLRERASTFQAAPSNPGIAEGQPKASRSPSLSLSPTPYLSLSLFPSPSPSPVPAGLGGAACSEAGVEARLLRAELKIPPAPERAGRKPEFVRETSPQVYFVVKWKAPLLAGRPRFSCPPYSAEGTAGSRSIIGRFSAFLSETRG